MYRYENGRRYHAYRDGAYYQPNDDRQAKAGSIEHHVWLLTLNDALFFAPLQDPQKVLDVGTGTGLWAVDMGDRYPSCEIIGTDLSPTQVPYAPPNVRFEIDDCCSEWTYPENSFDLIHVRGLTGSVGNWPKFYQECLKHIRPNGYLEQLEFGVDIHTDPAETPHDEIIRSFGPLLVEAGDRMGKTFEISSHMTRLIEQAGFVDVITKRFIWPIGPWSDDERLKELGRWNLKNWEDGMEGWVMALLTRIHGWSYEEVQNYRAQLLRGVKSKGVKAWHDVCVVYARKPE
ncbi:Methyltransferase type 11 [Lasiodiplodia theobromae]|uniref:Secondary metabolism regulator LAE1 n=2 Tax=Lasiodiplodia TaxID=66739 RepID=A0A5N5DT99_9PEZI|nr:Secondary metabolism regulator LAE1 [Lasiodiplodia theobromae]KAF9635462.1 Methyltransferase type 11 [Lasiodiplodia theobromae]KAK0664947.1 Secondary metabolism regulator LAE1 [Lasiodiplodia hormozganensis]